MTKDNEFDSSPTKPDRRVEAIHVVDALLVDSETAADSWVRFAKIRFRELMDVLNARRIEELKTAAHPLWTKQESVCFCVHTKEYREQASALITALVDDLAHDVMRLYTRRSFGPDRAVLVLVGALVVKAHDLGEGFYNFVLKQQFTVGSHEQT